MLDIREGQVEAIGASIHYQVSGHGPTLLLLADADGDAGAFDHLGPQLTGFTLVTFDRRGQRRSPIDDPTEPIGVATHADDAARVLVAVTTHAARVLGVGVGAVIGLELVARHPHRVSALVAFEPALPSLLDDDAPHGDDVAGAEGALFGAYAIDAVALRASHVRIVPGVSHARRGTSTHRVAAALGRRLHEPLIEFDGDPAARSVRPQLFASELAAILHSLAPSDGTA
ncbi:MAG: alpha/beta hydrolase [Vicinamibacteraceae bacterium]